MIFQDRKEAGQILSSRLSLYKSQKDVVCLGLARGGAVVAFEIAKVLNLLFNVVVPRKIGAPGYPEVAIGALAEDGEMWFNKEMIQAIAVDSSWIDQEVKKEEKILCERLERYRKIAPLEEVQGKTVLLVDDGIATGATVFVEIQSLRKQKPAKLVVVAPVSSIEAWLAIEQLADDAICLSVEENFLGVSQFYRTFTEVKDEEILALLRERKESGSR